MAYITQDDLLLYLSSKDVSELSDDALGVNAVQEVIEPILESASDMCDSYLRVRYTVPVTVTDHALKDACVRIASYILHLRRSWAVSDETKAAYDSTIDWLKDIANGKASLMDAVPERNRSYFGGQERIFQGVSHTNTTDNMHGF